MDENTEKNAFVIPRLGQGEQLLSAYDIPIKGIAKGRGSLIIYGENQTYMLKEFRGSKDKANALARVLEQLFTWDSHNERLIPTKEMEYTVQEEGGPAYILKTYHAGRECDVKSGVEVIEGARKLADLHIQLQQIVLENPSVFQAPEHGMEQEIFRHNRELRNLKNYIRKKKQENAFEEQYVSAYNEFYSQAQKIEDQILQEPEIIKESKIQICHGDFHHHNVYDCGGKSYIVHYENMRLDSAVADLTKYIRKVLEKNHWNQELGLQILNTYDRVSPLDEMQKKELHLRMSYPEKFWKIANHYNNNKKAWASKRDGEKLKQIIAQEKARQEFLELLYNRLK